MKAILKKHLKHVLIASLGLLSFSHAQAESAPVPRITDYQPFVVIGIRPSFTGLKYSPELYSNLDADIRIYSDIYKWRANYSNVEDLDLRFSPASPELVERLYNPSTVNPYASIFPTYYDRHNIKASCEFWQLEIDFDHNRATQEWLITFPEACLKSGIVDAEQNKAHLSLLQRKVNGSYQVLLSSYERISIGNPRVDMKKFQEDEDLMLDADEKPDFSIGITVLNKHNYPVALWEQHRICGGLRFSFRIENQQAKLISIDNDDALDSCSKYIAEEDNEAFSQYQRRLSEHNFSLAEPWLNHFTGQTWQYDPVEEDVYLK